MRIIKTKQPARLQLRGICVMLMAAFAGGAHAFEIDSGNTDVKIRWDNTIRYNVGVRTDAQDKRIMSNPTYDESDGKFGRGDVVTNRVDLLSEFDVNFRKQIGLRVSAAAWYDNAYDDHGVKSSVPGFSTSYNNDRYNSRVSRYVNGPSGEILDAFVWGNFNVAATPVNLKVGRQTNYFGEGLLFPAHAISYSQSPVDGVKAVTSPGIETKEVFLPVSQIFMKAQVTPNLTLAAQYFLDWQESRLPHGGTYFGPADPFFEGPDRLAAGPGFNLNHVDSVTPRKSGNFGLSARLNVEAIESVLGVYYRQFDDYNPWFAPNLTNFVSLAPGVVVPSAYRLVYPTRVKMFGVSAASVVGPVSVGSDLSYRKDGALNTNMVSPVDNQGPRGDTLHAVVNGVYLLPATKFWDTGTLIAELAYSRLLSVTSHADLYNGVGYGSCVTTGGTTPGDKSDGCSTKNYAALAVIFAPQYLQVLPSWDMELPVSVNYGLSGNAASAGGGNEKSLSWSVGTKMVYQQKHEFSLQYANTSAKPKYDPSGTTVIGGNGSVGTTDRGWLAFTYKSAF